MIFFTGRMPFLSPKQQGQSNEQKRQLLFCIGQNVSLSITPTFQAEKVSGDDIISDTL